MVGNFVFVGTPMVDAIMVVMKWSAGDERVASLNLPQDLGNLLKQADYPAPEVEMALESALSYGVFLAIRSGVPLALSGDQSAWNPAWGSLVGVSQAPYWTVNAH
jgi:hypothetical protein